MKIEWTLFLQAGKGDGGEAHIQMLAIRLFLGCATWELKNIPYIGNNLAKGKKKL